MMNQIGCANSGEQNLTTTTQLSQNSSRQTFSAKDRGQEFIISD
jgi:hypothetical protein